MVDLIRSWLVGITCAAMIAALAEGLIPSGPVRKIGRMTSGLVLLLAVLQPLLRLDPAALSRSLAAYRLDLQAYSDSLEEENAELMKGIIEEQAGAYIVDKAAGLGIYCQVQVEAGGEGEYPVPYRVWVTGELTTQQQEILTRQIEADFAVPADRQAYQSESEGKG